MTPEQRLDLIARMCGQAMAVLNDLSQPVNSTALLYELLDVVFVVASDDEHGMFLVPSWSARYGEVA